MAESPRLADVAAAAGVSLATASRALSGRGSVADATRGRVLEAAARLDFHPSATGRSLRLRSTRMIGFVVPDIASPFYANALKGAQHRLQAAGYQVNVMDTNEAPDRERAALFALAAGRVDGFILAPSGDGLAIRTVERRFGLPIVMFDNVVEGCGAGRVTLANEEGLHLLVGHLAEVHGHRRIGYVGGLPGETSGAERLAGFELAMLRQRLPVDPGWVRSGEWTEAAGAAATAELLDLDEPPTAIVYPSADLALGGLTELKARRVAVPDDVAIACFDDFDAAPLLDPPLTVLTRRDRQVGDLAASMVLRALEHADAEPMDVRISVELQVRRSCGCAELGPAGGATGAAGASTADSAHPPTFMPIDRD
jgi:DNA-binding LacI/PurR family transcriptional regulator